MMVFKEAKDFISEYSEQITEVFEHFGAVPHFSYEEKPNPYGGNPEYIIHFSVDWRCPMKEKDFVMQPAAESAEMFFNRIRAYMFDCIDAFCNL